MIPEEVLEQYAERIESGDYQDVVDEFFLEYILPELEVYDAEVAYQVKRILRDIDSTKEVEREVTKSHLGIVVALAGLYSSFVKREAPVIFAQNNLKKGTLKKQIIDNCIRSFENRIRETMSQTNSSLLYQIREYQKQMIIRNIGKAGKQANIKNLTKVEADFFRKRFPDLFERGGLVTSNGKKMATQSYFDMATRTTLLNVDRDSIEAVARFEEIPVVELYLRDNRPVQSERDICKVCMGMRIAGVPLLAMDSEVAGKLGIISLDDYRAQGGMGMWCRHSIRRPAAAIMNKVSELLKEVA